MEKLILKIPGETNYLAKIREFVNVYAERMGFGEEALGEIEMAVDEAATNIIKHSYDEDPDIPDENKIIEVKLEDLKNAIEISIRDRGKPFNPENVPDPDLNDHVLERKTHGLGIFAMRKFMDDIKHRYIQGVGNEIILKKFVERP